jgi:hypothetical protein
MLAKDRAITHVFAVHCETTSGILNPIAEVAALVARHGRRLLVDSMSAFGALEIDARQIRYDALAASSNKCLEGVPALGTNDVIIASTAKVPEPCTGTVTCVPCPPASSTILSSTIRLMPRKPASREPQSWTMACLTLAEVVSGPGVSRSGSPVSEAAGLRVVMT